MSHSRIKNRQEKKATLLLNKLFLEFTHHLNDHSTSFEGLLYLDEHLIDKFNECNNQWRRFVTSFRQNSKRRTDFAVYAFQEKADSYVDNLKKQIWKKYMISLMDEKYGLDTSYDLLENYYQVNLDPEEAGIRIVMDIPTINVN